MSSLRSQLAAAAALIVALTAQSSVTHAAIVNGGFEAPLVSTFVPNDGVLFVPPHYAYVPDGGASPVTAASWTYFAGAGLINGHDPGAFNGEPNFVGDQYAFIQGNGSYISQVFSATPGIGRIDWVEAGRPFNGCCNGDQILKVFLNGNLVGTFPSLSNQLFTPESIIGVTFGSTNTLQFIGTALGDNTAFLDEVSVTTVTPTPLPAAWTMMLIGLCGLVAFRGMRKRSAALAAV